MIKGEEREKMGKRKVFFRAKKCLALSLAAVTMATAANERARHLRKIRQTQTLQLCQRIVHQECCRTKIEVLFLLTVEQISEMNPSIL